MVSNKTLHILKLCCYKALKMPAKAFEELGLVSSSPGDDSENLNSVNSLLVPTNEFVSPTSLTYSWEDVVISGNFSFKYDRNVVL